MDSKPINKITLPIDIASKQDIVHVYRELSAYFDFMTQNAIRSGTDAKLSRVSETLKSLAELNKIDLKNSKSCETLLAGLQEIKKTAPSIHVSFSVEPTPEVLQKIVAWFREKVDPMIIIQVGLQPSVAAGIVLRTPNKQFDFSLRNRLNKNRSKLIEALES